MHGTGRGAPACSAAPRTRLAGRQLPLLSLSLRCAAAGRRVVAGSGIGSIQETQEMLDFCGKARRGG